MTNGEEIRKVPSPEVTGVASAEKDPPMVGTVTLAEVIPVACTVGPNGALKTTLIEPSIWAFTRRRPDATCCAKTGAQGARNRQSVASVRIKKQCAGAA